MNQLIDAINETSTNRRISLRFQPTFGTTCRIANMPQQGLVWDISMNGLGLLLPYAPVKGEIISVELETEAEPELLKIDIKVAHVRMMSTGDYFVGAQFTRTLTATEIEPYISPIMGKPYFAVMEGSKKATQKTPQAAKTPHQRTSKARATVS